MKINLGATPLSALYVGATKVYPSPAPAISSVATVADLPAGGPAAGQPTHVFVVADSNVYEWKGGKWVLLGLTGVGGWADVASATGAVDNAGTVYTDSTGFKWRVWKWTADGTVTFSKAPGLVEVFAVGGGRYDTGAGGDGGSVVNTLIKIPGPGPYSVVIGAGGVGGSDGVAQLGHPTRIVGLVDATGARAAGQQGAMGATGSANGVVSSFSGVSHEYGASGARMGALTNAEDRYGMGGVSAIRNAAFPGVLMVRRPE